MPHCGPHVAPFQHDLDISPLLLTDSYSEKLVRQVFFYAQLHLPLKWKHEGKNPHMNNVDGRDSYGYRHNRASDWVFRTGKRIDIALNHGGCSWMPDFIGWCMFGRNRLHKSSQLSIVSLPSQIQGTVGLIVKKFQKMNEMEFSHLVNLIPTLVHHYHLSTRGSTALFPFMVFRLSLSMV